MNVFLMWLSLRNLLRNLFAALLARGVLAALVLLNAAVRVLDRARATRQ
jgi:hypothetical protein